MASKSGSVSPHPARRMVARKSTGSPQKSAMAEKSNSASKQTAAGNRGSISKQLFLTPDSMPTLARVYEKSRSVEHPSAKPAMSMKRSASVATVGDVIYMCEHCSQSYDSVAELKAHKAKCEEKTEETSVGVLYACDYCGQQFNTLPHLTQHKQHYHAAEEQQMAAAAAAQAKTETEFVAPPIKVPKVQTVTLSPAKASACRYCNQQFFTAGPVTIHERYCAQNKTKKRFICQGCGHRYEQEDAFRSHLGSCTKKPLGQNLAEIETGVTDGRSAGTIIKAEQVKVQESLRETLPTDGATSKQAAGEAGPAKMWFKCEFCGCKRSSVAELRIHWGVCSLKPSTSSAPYVMDIKPAKSSESPKASSSTIIDHDATTDKQIKQAKADANQRFMVQCEKCQMVFESFDFINHMGQCKRNDPSVVRQCRFCQKDFHSYTLKKNHESKCPAADENVVLCFECYLPIPTDENCTMKGFCACGTGQGFICSCKKIFTTQVSLSSHQESCVDMTSKGKGKGKSTSQPGKKVESASEKEVEADQVEEMEQEPIVKPAQEEASTSLEQPSDTEIPMEIETSGKAGSENLPSPEVSKDAQETDTSKMPKETVEGAVESVNEEAEGVPVEASDAAPNTQDEGPAQVNAENSSPIKDGMMEIVPSKAANVSEDTPNNVERVTEKTEKAVVSEGKTKALKTSKKKDSRGSDNTKSDAIQAAVSAAAKRIEHGCQYCGMTDFKNEKNLDVHQRFCKWIRDQKVVNKVSRSSEEMESEPIMGNRNLKSRRGASETTGIESDIIEGEQNGEALKKKSGTNVTMVTEGEAMNVMVGEGDAERKVNGKEQVKEDAGMVEEEMTESKEAGEQDDEINTNQEMEEDTVEKTNSEHMCLYCNSLFGNKTYLLSHVRKCSKIHQNAATRQEEEKESTIKEELEEVVDSADEDAKLLCKTCKKYFQRALYTNHVRRCQYNVEHPCKLCGHVYPNRQEFMAHLQQCTQDHKLSEGESDSEASLRKSPRTTRRGSVQEDGGQVSTRAKEAVRSSPRTQKKTDSSPRRMVTTSRIAGASPRKLDFGENVRVITEDGSTPPDVEWLVIDLQDIEAEEKVAAVKTSANICRYCDCAFGNGGALTNHLKWCEQLETLPPEERDSMRKAELERRQKYSASASRQEKGESAVEHLCEYCKVVFGNRGALIVHMRYCRFKSAVQEDETDKTEKQQSKANSELTCPHCENVFHNKKALTLHLQYKYCQQESTNKSPSDELCCPYCDTTCGNRGGFVTHMRYCKSLKSKIDTKNEDKEKGSDNVCMYCKKSFGNKGAMRSHTLHCKNKPANKEDTLTCPLCFTKFGNRGARTTHMKSCKGLSAQPGDERTCEDCKLTFGTMSALYKHKKIGCKADELDDPGEGTSGIQVPSGPVDPHDLEYKYLFLCPECGQPYKSKETLKFHLVACLSGVEYPKGEPDPEEVAAKLERERLAEIAAEKLRNVRKSPRKPVRKRDLDKEAEKAERARQVEKEKRIQMKSPKEKQSRSSQSPTKKFKSAKVKAEEKKTAGKSVKFSQPVEVKKENKKKAIGIPVVDDSSSPAPVKKGSKLECGHCGWSSVTGEVSLRNHIRYCPVMRQKKLGDSSHPQRTVAPAQLKCDVCNRTGFTNLGSLNNHRAFCTWIRTLVPRNPILNPRQKAGQSGQAVRPKGPKSSQQQQQQQARNPLKRTLSTPTTSVFEVSAKHARHNTTDTPTGTIRIKQEEGVEPKTPAFQGTTVIELEDDSEDEDGEEEMVQGHNTPKVTFEWVQDQSAPKIMYECEFCSRASGNRGAMLQHMKYCYYRHGADPNTIINPTQTVVG